MKPTPKSNWKHMSEDEARAVAKLAVRYGITKAAEVSGRNWATVRTACHRCKVTAKTIKMNTPSKTRKRAVKLYSTGEYSFAQVGKLFGVSGVRVHQWALEQKREAA